MIKILSVLVLFFSFTQAEILEPEEAFKVSFEKSADQLDATIDLHESIYLYADQLKVYAVYDDEKTEITSNLQLRKPKEYEGFITYFDFIDINIDDTLYKGANAVEISYQGCSKAGLCYPPTTVNYELQPATADTKDASGPVDTGSIAQKMQDSSFIWVLLTFFGFGVLLSLTPCVFPMVPILSSIIVSHSSDKQKMSAKRGLFLSIVYVLAMSVAYTIAGVIAGVFGANLQAALQNPFVLLSFAAIFVALAFSMFGYYKLELPQSIQNAINKKTDGQKGIQGVAIMGFLSALIVGPCVAPPLAGALVYIGQTGDAFLGGAALFVMSIGMGLPLLALGAGAGKFMPKPGGWMDAVSKVFGVVMLGVAIWMLERVIPPFFTMLLWAALLLGSALYLKAYKLKKPNLKHAVGIVLGLYGFAVAIGAFSGATSPLNPLKHFYGQQKEAMEFTQVKSVEQIEDIVSQTDKVVMIDFTASWCVNCKDLKEITFMDDRVQEVMDEFVLLKADVTKNSAQDRAMMQKYNVFGPPALIFYKEGKEVEKHIIGYVDAQQFLNYVKSNL
ncbi:MAG: protein-disulfide reductase DsbD [Campylobacterota bacterium]